MKSIRPVIRDYLLLITGSIIMALSMAVFMAGNGLIPGGISGISNIFHRLFDFPVGATGFVISLVIFLFGLKLLGKLTALKTAVSFTVLAVLTDVFMAALPAFTNDKLLAAAFGGLLSGVGLGLILIGGGSISTTDLVARILNRKFKLPVGPAILVMDSIPIIAGAILFGREMLLYSIIEVAVLSFAVEKIEGGVTGGKQFFIITQKKDAVAAYVMETLGRTATVFNGEGAYSGEARTMLMCVVKPWQVLKFRNDIINIDSSAFLTVSDIRAVQGNGFEGN